MPSRNIIKTDTPNSYYHVYARGINKQNIFLDREDFQYFINLFGRYLSVKPTQTKENTPYPHYRAAVQLLCYCLMPNHFHLLLYQIEEGGMSKIMRSIMTSYSRYFNLKYKRRGPLFESRYKASRIDVDEYLQHISRYIHLNPRYWKTYAYSSVAYYENNSPPEWLETTLVLASYGSTKDYIRFLRDYEDYKRMLDELKHELADM